MDSEGSFGMIQITCVEARVHDGPLYRKPSEACWEAFVRAMLTDMPPALAFAHGRLRELYGTTP